MQQQMMHEQQQYYDQEGVQIEATKPYDYEHAPLQGHDGQDEEYGDENGQNAQY